MKLQAFLSSLTPADRDAFAELIGSTPGYVRMLRLGHKRVGPALAKRVFAAPEAVRITEGAAAATTCVVERLSSIASKAFVTAAVRTANCCRAVCSNLDACCARAKAVFAATAVALTNRDVVGDRGCAAATAAADIACEAASFAAVAFAIAVFKRDSANCRACTAILAWLANTCADGALGGAAANTTVGASQPATKASSIGCHACGKHPLKETGSQILEGWRDFLVE